MAVGTKEANTPDPLMLDVPAELRTQRLLLRVPRPGDGERVCRTVRASLDELKAWMPWATDGYGPRDAEQWCRRGAAQFLAREQLQYLLFLGPGAGPGEHVGNVGVFAFRWQVPCCEVGYWLATAQCGKGLMTEAVSAVVGMAFEALSMQRVEIRTDSRNARSGRVAERCGFQLEGILRHDSRHVDGTLRDTRVYSRLRA
jgi:RimJ/RimL family protein N-acetyltransferase